jgi:hypothetical protein
MAEEPLWPPAAAVTVALPAATAVTKPLAFTVATDGLLLVQVNVTPLITLPF